MKTISSLLLEKNGVTTVKKFTFFDAYYTETTIIMNSDELVIPTSITKNFEEGVYPIKLLIDEGYQFINPHNTETEIKLLLPKIISRLKKIGLQENDYFDKFERQEIETTSGKRILPAAMNQFQQFNWHESGLNDFKTTLNIDDELWSICFGIGGDLSEYPNFSFEGAYFMIGHYGSGNYLLLFNADDKNPNDPEIFKMNHDPYGEEFPVYNLGKLSYFVSKMKIQKRIQE